MYLIILERSFISVCCLIQNIIKLYTFYLAVSLKLVLFPSFVFLFTLTLLKSQGQGGDVAPLGESLPSICKALG